MDVSVQLKKSLVHLEPLCRPVTDVVARFPFCTPERGGKFTIPADPIIWTEFESFLANTGINIQGTGVKDNRVQVDDPIKWDTDLYDYQIEGANYMRRVRRCILADDTGTGKTKSTVEALADKSNVLIISPLYKCEDWVKALGDRFTTNQITSAFKGKMPKTFGKVVVINYEKVSKLPATFWSTVVLEEAHLLQNRNSNRTKTIAKLCNGVENVWMLTATPVWNEPSAIWSLLNILDSKRFGSFWRFVESFCVMRDTKFAREIVGARQDTLPIFRRIVADYMLRRMKRDVLDLPPRVEHEVLISSSPAILKELRLFKGAMKDEDGYVNLCNLRRKILEIGGKKDELARILAAEAGKKILVFVKYRASAALALEWLKDGFGLLGYINDVPITGDVTTDVRERIIKEFESYDGGGVLLGTAKCMGTGLDLQCASVIVFLEHPFLYSELDQCCGRIERIGTTEVPTYYHLVQKGTVDEKIWRTCVSRSSTAEGIISG